MRDAGDNRQPSYLVRSHGSSRHRMDRHRDRRAQGTSDEGNSRFASVRHIAHSRHKWVTYDSFIRRKAAMWNKRGASVQESKMIKATKTKKKLKTPQPKQDRRILRTRDKLGDALIALMQEKDFDDITVQNVLDRAGVGRSTFYVHYRDKNDLFLSDVEDFLELTSSALKRQDANA